MSVRPAVVFLLQGLTMGRLTHPRATTQSDSLLSWAERLFFTAGAATLVWCAINVADGVIAQWSARNSLEVASITETPAPAPAPPASRTVVEPPPQPHRGGERVREVRPPAAHRGSAIAMLSIPRVHLSAAVLHGSDTKTLRRGPGHLEDTAFPGDAGNVVIAGHRDSYFRPLRNIKIGDDIFLDTPQGRFQYRVESTRVVDPRDLSVLARTDEDVLTLITCYPFSVLGNAPDRFIVRAAAVVNSAVASPAGNPSPLPSLDLSAPYESTVVPPPYEAAATRAVIRETDAVRDDDSLVRLAVERFRLTYNGRLVSRRDVRPLAPLRFETCRVDVTDDRATATCAVVEPSDDALRVRTFMLERVDGGWAIRTIVAN